MCLSLLYWPVGVVFGRCFQSCGLDNSDICNDTLFPLLGFRRCWLMLLCFSILVVIFDFLAVSTAIPCLSLVLIHGAFIFNVFPLGVVCCICDVCGVFALLLLVDSSSWLNLLCCWVGGFGFAPGGYMSAGLRYCRFVVDILRCRVGVLLPRCKVGVDSVRCGFDDVDCRCRVGVVCFWC